MQRGDAKVLPAAYRTTALVAVSLKTKYDRQLAISTWGLRQLGSKLPYERNSLILAASLRFAAT